MVKQKCIVITNCALCPCYEGCTVKQEDEIPEACALEDFTPRGVCLTERGTADVHVRGNLEK